MIGCKFKISKIYAGWYSLSRVSAYIKDVVRKTFDVLYVCAREKSDLKFLPSSFRQFLEIQQARSSFCEQRALF